MTMSEPNLRKLGQREYLRDSHRACFQRRQIVTVAVKVGRPLTIAEEKHFNGELEGIYVVQIAFNFEPTRSDQKHLGGNPVRTFKLYRHCSDVRIAASLMRRVLSVDGGVGFCCSTCCADHAVTPVASSFFCAEHSVYPLPKTCRLVREYVRFLP